VAAGLALEVKSTQNLLGLPRAELHSGSSQRYENPRVIIKLNWATISPVSLLLVALILALSAPLLGNIIRASPQERLCLAPDIEEDRTEGKIGERGGGQNPEDPKLRHRDRAHCSYMDTRTIYQSNKCNEIIHHVD